MRIYSCIPAFLHVENVGQDLVVAEVEEAEAEGPEQQLQESEVAAEEQELGTDFINPDLQQGKHQSILNPVYYIHLSFMQLLKYFYLCI